MSEAIPEILTSVDGLIHQSTNPGEPQFIDRGYPDTGFLIWGAAMVFIMTPGLGFFYSGMAREISALHTVLLCMLALCVVTVQWVLWGYSLTFSETGSNFIGNMDFVGLTGVGANGAGNIPNVVFCFYQLQFACVTAAIIFGSVAERVRVLPAMIFVFCWTTLVYDFAAYWTWNGNGWLLNLGGLDFAGGGPVHIASGFGGLAYTVFVGKSKGQKTAPHNLKSVFLGTALLWFGWIAFNGGSALGANARAGMAALVTFICAATSGLVWVLWDAMFTSKYTALGFCSGAVGGLVVITPAAGFVAPWAAIVMGVIGGIVLNYATKLGHVIGVDDTLDAWSIHGLGGFLGSILTGVFAQKWIAELDGGEIDGGAIDGFPMLIGYNLAGSVAIAGWSFGVSYILLFIINFIPGCKVRMSEGKEEQGADASQMGEAAYDITPAQDKVKDFEEKV